MRQSDYTELKRRLEQFYSPQYADDFMKSPQEHLGGRRPVDCLYTEVSQLVNRMEQYL